LLPFVVAALVMAGLCSFVFVRRPAGPEVVPPAQSVVLQQPERSSAPPPPSSAEYASWASMRSAPLAPAPKLVPQSVDPPAASVPPQQQAAPPQQQAAPPQQQAAPPQQQAEALSDSEVQEVQSRLQALQLDPGPADGVAGPQTTSAVQRYQAGKGRPTTGQLDRPLLESLRREAQSR
jgi:hypothetical protein